MYLKQCRKAPTDNGSTGSEGKKCMTSYAGLEFDCKVPEDKTGRGGVG